MDSTTTKQHVRRRLTEKLRLSGLIEYACEHPGCRTQVFSTWPVRLECRDCHQPLRLAYRH